LSFGNLRPASANAVPLVDSEAARATVTMIDLIAYLRQVGED